jgi:competence protein ComEC
MEPRDNASAARSCLVILAIGAVLLLVACVLIALRIAPVDILPEKPTPTAVRPEPHASPATSSSGGTLTFAVMDVGQGMSVVIITPDGYSMVIDGGKSGERVRQEVIPFLQDHGVTQLDYVVMTHPDQDHIGGLPALLEAMPVRAWVDPVIETTNQSYEKALKLVQDRNITPIRARRGGTLDLGPLVKADILWPPDGLYAPQSDSADNNNSVVIKITYGDRSFLITGDIQEAAERQLVEQEQAEELHSDVLVVAHHGSKTSSSGDFLDAVTPSIAIIPVGAGNQYGHPNDEVLQRLTMRGIEIYRTDQDGRVVVTSDGTTMSVKTSAVNP